MRRTPTGPPTFFARWAGAVALLLAVLAQPARAEDMRPPVGGVSSPADAMIFYVAHGSPGACGPGCSEWIAAEGAVEWDTYKRLFALLDRLGARKLPLILKVQGAGDLKVATALGRIIRERGLDVSVAGTRLAQCWGASETACFALKQGGGPLEGNIDRSFVDCDIVCVLILAGGVNRTLPANARVVVRPPHIRNRLAPNVSPERREGVKARFDEQVRLYLTEMGVSTEVADIIDQAAASGRAIAIRRDGWLRLHIVTRLAL